MKDLAQQLFVSLRALQGPCVGQGRWYSRGKKRWDGPFDAAEVAYLIANQHICATDTILNGRTGASYVVQDTPFLAGWVERDPRRSKKLILGLLTTYRRRAQLLGKPSPWGLPSWAARYLSDEQLDAFELLESEPTTPPETIKRRHRRLALKHHPDRGGNAEDMHRINKAFEMLRQAFAF